MWAVGAGTAVWSQASEWTGMRLTQGQLTWALGGRAENFLGGQGAAEAGNWERSVCVIGYTF